MKKLLIFIMFLLGLGYSFANWYDPHQVYYGNAGATACDDDNDGVTDPTCVQISGVPAAGTNEACPSGPINVASTGYMTCLYWDGTPPNITDLSLKLDGISPGGSVLANNSANLNFTYNDTNGGGASSIIVYYELENANTAVLGVEQSITINTNDGLSSGSVSRDISKVLPSLDFSGAIGGRQYSLKVTKICDSAENCVSVNKIYNWDVYANTPLSHEVKNFSDLNNTKVANGENYFGISLTLKDQYGNPIVPAPGINRTLRVGVSYANEVYLNQYKLTGAGIYYKYAGGSYTASIIGSSENFTGDYINYNSVLSGGLYTFDFKSYVPTFAGYDKAYGNFTINSLSYVLSGNLLNVSNNFSISQNLKFSPQLYTDISGIPPLASEGTYKEFKVTTSGASTNYIAYTFLVQFDPGDSDINTYLSVDNPTSWQPYSIYGYSGSNLFSSAFGVSPTSNLLGELGWNSVSGKTFYEKAELKEGGQLSSSNQGIVSTHVAVKYSDGTIAVWNSDLVGANNYNYNSTLENYISENAIYIQGLISSSNYSKIYSIYSGTDISLQGKIAKPELRAKIHHLFKQNLGNLKYYLISSYNYNIWNDGLNKKIKDIKGTEVFYFKGNGTDGKLVIPGIQNLNKKILLILDNVDLFITGNVQTDTDGEFAILSLSDKNNPRGNIFIKNNITNLDSLIYSDKAVITYEGDPMGIYKTQDEMSQDDLKNQLLIKGVLRSFNTYGGSVRNYCPYFNTSCSNPKKYDLQYLRRFYLIKANVLDPSSGSNYYVPYGITNTGDINDTILIGGIKCDFVDCNGDGKKEAKCYDTNSNLTNLLSIGTSGVCNPFNVSSDKLRKLFPPVRIDYDGRFKLSNYYIPIFSDL